MLGYINKTKALDYGMTHHGSYYGIPIWIAPDNPDCLVCAKWYPMEYLMQAVHYIEGFMRSVLYPGDEPMFQFVVGSEIEITPKTR